MKCRIAYIGVIDHLETIHSVPFEEGLNIITGKSSTGKSALIEIFDYCFGSSDYTVPDGEITRAARLYFVIFKFPHTHLAIAREPDSPRAFIREIESIDTKDKQPQFFPEFFEDKFFLALRNFKQELARYFRLTITDVETDLERADYRRRSSPAPSIRSFTSFMLQHQNLVANKHAVFYRFDEKEKREQAIEHIKIFLGFVDQEYYITSQKINLLKSELRKLELSLPKKRQQEELNEQVLNSYMSEYASVTGSRLVSETSQTLLNNPYLWFQKIQKLDISYDGSSEESSIQLKKFEKQRAELVVELRGLERKQQSISSSIEYAEKYATNLENLGYPNTAREAVAECPFCEQKTNAIEKEFSELSEAVNWLNTQLKNSPYMKSSFQSDERKVIQEINQKRKEVKEVEGQILNAENKIKEISERSSVRDVALRIKLRIENFLEDLSSNKISDIEKEIEKLRKQIQEHNRTLAAYNVKQELAKVEASVSNTMNIIGNRLDFEESYKPLNLRFSFETFDLWNEKDKNKKVFLRSMGSGANWLYCHLVLFMSLHKLFCERGEECKIPPIVFFDQPTQVYFPNTSLDTTQEFDAKALVSTDKVQHVDDDIESVNRFFSELIDFCDSTEKETGIKPQIIITDHADHLKLDNGKVFEKYVRARWRTHGFIEFSDNSKA